MTFGRLIRGYTRDIKRPLTLARLYDDGNSESLSGAGAVVADGPVTLACWFNSNDAAAVQTLMSIDDSGGPTMMRMVLVGSVGGDPLYFQRGTGGDSAITTTGYSVGKWHHGCATAQSGTGEIQALIDGGSKGIDGVTAAVASLDLTSIGWSQKFDEYMSGRISLPAIWSCILTDSEIWQLAQGALPWHIRPQSLVACWDENGRNLVNNRFQLTPVNAPGYAGGPPRLRNMWMVPFGSPSIIQTTSVIATATAVLKETASNAATGRAIIKMIAGFAAASRAVLQETASATAALTAVLKETVERTAAGRAVIKMVATATVPLRAVLKETAAFAATVRAVLKEVVSTSTDNKAVLKETASNSAVARAVVKMVTSATAAGRAVLKETANFTAACQARLVDIGAVQATANLFAVLRETMSNSAIGRAILRETASFTAAVQARINQVFSFAAGLRAVLKETAVATAACQAWIVGVALGADMIAGPRAFGGMALTRAQATLAVRRGQSMVVKK